MNKQKLASKIWESANKMRSKIEANEYKDYILGFMFYKFISEQEEQLLAATCLDMSQLAVVNEGDREVVKYVQGKLGYFIGYDNLFSTWISKGIDFGVDDVMVAMSAFNRLINPEHKQIFDGVFDTLQTGLTKLGDTAASQSRSVRDLVYLIKDIPMDGKQGYDVLGFIYEYLLEKFAANAGKKAGEFYTPHEVSLLMSEIVAEHLKDRETIEIYDPTSGSGSLLLNIGESVQKFIKGKNKIRYYAQELKQATYNLTRMNLVMRGVIADNIVTRNGDTLEADWPLFDDNDPQGTYKTLYVDAVVSNPPYSQMWNPDDKENDPRFAEYGLAPKGKADYAFLLHSLYHLRNEGIMTIVLPHGVLFRGGEEERIRKNLIEKNNIDAIIGLPANIFFGTGIPTLVLVLKKKRETTDVMFIDGSKGFIKDGKTNKLRSSDIKRITDTLLNRTDIPKFSRVVSREEIRANNYNLNIPRYIDTVDDVENWDLYSLVLGGIPNAEVDNLSEYWNAFPSLKDALFKPRSEYSYDLQVEDIQQAIQENADVKQFTQDLQGTLKTFAKGLTDRLIPNAESVDISQAKEELTVDLFNKIHEIPLIDKYDGYQLFDDNWGVISNDLLIIQTEGLSVVKQTEPNMVIKKNGSSEIEVLDGYKGVILPYKLVQNELLTTELSNLQDLKDSLSEVQQGYTEILDSLTDEERESAFVSNDSFVLTEVKKALKVATDETREKLLKVQELNTKEKEIKSRIKKGEAELEAQTKATIEGLTDEQALDLLGKKWVEPLITSLQELPHKALCEMSMHLLDVYSKYKTSLQEIDTEIKSEQRELSLLLDELTGPSSDLEALHALQCLFD